MANEPAQAAGRALSGNAGLTGVRMAGVRPCPSCNTLISVHATVCPNCGENVAIKEKTVHCRRCRGRASSRLTICPHCGRDLQPATTRWLTWGIPLLVLLFLAGLLFVRLSRGNLAQWTQTQGERIARLAESLTSRVQPEFSVALIPPGQDPNDPLVSQSIQSSTDAGAGATVSNPPNELSIAPPPADTAAQTATNPVEGAATGSPDDTPNNNAGAAPAVAALEPTEPAGATIAAEQTPTAVATAAAAEATATALATATTPAATPPATATAQAPPAAKTATPAPLQAAGRPVTGTMTGTVAGMVAAAATQVAAGTATVAPTPTGTPAIQTAAAPNPAASLINLLTPTPLSEAPAVREVYTVKRGDTVFDIAILYDISVDDLLAFNSLVEDDVYTIQPGDELNIPAPTPVGAPTATPGPTPASYTVRPGDTISEIARALGLTMDELMAANNLTLNNARTLQPGAVLLLPGAAPATPAMPATPTTAPAATPTAAATWTPAASPSPAAASAGALPVNAPRLRSPENGAALSCNGQNTLNWLAVPTMRTTDVYLVHLGYVNDIAADGKEEIIWVMTQQQPAGTTSWQLDNDFCGLAPVTEGKQWRWYVEAAEKTTNGLQPVSPASPVWGFAWQ